MGHKGMMHAAKALGMTWCIFKDKKLRGNKKEFDQGLVNMSMTHI